MKKKVGRVLSDIVKTLPKHEKVILYCPTYRRDRPTKFFPFDDFDIRHFNRFLEENKVVVLVRSHAYEKGNMHFFSNRIIGFGFDVCNDINQILPEVDILVTDYSSLYVDYLLLDKPCIFIPYDFEEYVRKRGLLLEYSYWARGYRVLTYQKFVKAIEEIFSGADIYRKERQELRKQLLHCQTENSCKEIVKVINGWRNRNE
jgi:CDP-glycerol glycerophosphotransferase